MKAILMASSAAVLFASSVPATAAQTGSEARSVKVDYSDLNLADAHGVSTLEQRVTGAIHQVCDGATSALNEKMQQQACARSPEKTAGRSIQNAISNARQLSSTRPAGTSSTIVDRTISIPTLQRSSRQDLTRRR